MHTQPTRRHEHAERQPEAVIAERAEYEPCGQKNQQHGPNHDHHHLFRARGANIHSVVQEAPDRYQWCNNQPWSLFACGQAHAVDAGQYIDNVLAGY